MKIKIHICSATNREYSFKYITKRTKKTKETSSSIIAEFKLKSKEDCLNKALLNQKNENAVSRQQSQ